MDKENLMFYSAYEDFYKMTAQSATFGEYCKMAFGMDFSQDGFSDIKQIKFILTKFPQKDILHILDVGCGNGKLLKYLEQEISCCIHGFDYSENAIKTAKMINGNEADFQVGCIDDMIYPTDSFDVVLSMDSIYFSKDMTTFVKNVFGWLKTGGKFIVGYQEGDVIPKTENADSSLIAQSLHRNGIEYQVDDITYETYNLLVRKRKVIKEFYERFKEDGISMWYDVVLNQTDSILVSYDEYRKNNARYIFTIQKD